jgi:hypothetical protein
MISNIAADVADLLYLLILLPMQDHKVMHSNG